MNDAPILRLHGALAFFAALVFSSASFAGPARAQTNAESISRELAGARLGLRAVLDSAQRTRVEAIAHRAQRDLDAAVRAFRERTGGVRSELTWDQRLAVVRAGASGSVPALSLDPGQRARVAQKMRALASDCEPVVDRASREIASILRADQRAPLARLRADVERDVRGLAATAIALDALAPERAAYDAPDLGLFVLSTELDIDELTG